MSNQGGACAGCGATVDRLVTSRDGRLLCVSCFDSSSSASTNNETNNSAATTTGLMVPCASCDQPVPQSSAVSINTAAGTIRYYHSFCLKCLNCSKTDLGSSCVTDKLGRIFCSTICCKAYLATMCAACYLAFSDTQTQVKLGEKIYHKTCLQCHKCRSPLSPPPSSNDPGSPPLVGTAPQLVMVGSRFYCPTCAQRQANSKHNRSVSSAVPQPPAAGSSTSPSLSPRFPISASSANLPTVLMATAAGTPEAVSPPVVIPPSPPSPFLSSLVAPSPVPPVTPPSQGDRRQLDRKPAMSSFLDLPNSSPSTAAAAAAVINRNMRSPSFSSTAAIVVGLSVEKLLFGIGDGKQPIGETLEDSFTIENTTVDSTVLWKITLPSKAMTGGRYDIVECSPMEGKLTTKNEANKKQTVTVKIVVHCTTCVRETIVIDCNIKRKKKTMLLLSSAANSSEGQDGDKEDGSSITLRLPFEIDSKLSTALDWNEIVLCHPSLGKGASGEVFRGKWRDENCAIKGNPTRQHPAMSTRHLSFLNLSPSISIDN